MAKITDEDRSQYANRINVFKTTVDTILKNEQDTLALIKENPEEGAFMRLGLADAMLNLSSHYMIMNGVSQSVLKVKNEEALNDARNSLHKAIFYLEGLVTSLIDAPFSEYEEQLAAIESISSAQRYLLVRKLGLTVQLLENAYGDNTKWKWAFVELEGRYATVTKNLLDLRTVMSNIDPRSPNYEPTVYHLHLVKKLLMQAADRYREKYELSTSQMDDFKMGILFLSALKRLHTVMGDKDDMVTVKKKLDIWSAKLESDIKKKEDRTSKKN